FCPTRRSSDLGIDTALNAIQNGLNDQLKKASEKTVNTSSPKTSESSVQRSTSTKHTPASAPNYSPAQNYSPASPTNKSSGGCWGQPCGGGSKKSSGGGKGGGGGSW